jgi:cytochrome bd-type quinol oxidase subunit 1
MIRATITVAIIGCAVAFAPTSSGRASQRQGRQKWIITIYQRLLQQILNSSYLSHNFVICHSNFFFLYFCPP